MDTMLLASMLMSSVLLREVASSDDLQKGQPLLAHFPGTASAVTSGKVELAKEYSTTSSLGITWDFKNYTPNGTIEAVFVGWDLKYGRFVSNKLQYPLDHEFEFTHLQSDTEYLVCIEALERAVWGQVISHVHCATLSTIAPMRTDSILVLLLVLGYFVLMPLLGCLLWRRKLSQLGGGGESHGLGLGNHYGHDRNVMRWKDIEERVVLNPNGES